VKTVIDPDLVQAFLKKWLVESDFKAPTSPFHHGSKVPAVTITVFITILEQNNRNHWFNSFLEIMTRMTNSVF
jgi:hypothetical protein